MAVRITLKVSLCAAGFHRLFVYACLISQSRGSIPYIGLGVETSGQCGCSVVRVGASLTFLTLGYCGKRQQRGQEAYNNILIKKL